MNTPPTVLHSLLASSSIATPQGDAASELGADGAFAEIFGLFLDHDDTGRPGEGMSQRRGLQFSLVPVTKGPEITELEGGFVQHLNTPLKDAVVVTKDPVGLGQGTSGRELPALSKDQNSSRSPAPIIPDTELPVGPRLPGNMEPVRQTMALSGSQPPTPTLPGQPVAKPDISGAPVKPERALPDVEPLPAIAASDRGIQRAETRLPGSEPTRRPTTRPDIPMASGPTIEALPPETATEPLDMGEDRPRPERVALPENRHPASEARQNVPEFAPGIRKMAPETRAAPTKPDFPLEQGWHPKRSEGAELRPGHRPTLPAHARGRAAEMQPPGHARQTMPQPMVQGASAEPTGAEVSQPDAEVEAHVKIAEPPARHETARAISEPQAQQAPVAPPSAAPLPEQIAVATEETEARPVDQAPIEAATRGAEQISPIRMTEGLPTKAASQIVEAAKSLQPGRALNITLNPPELGQVRLALQPLEAGMSVVIMVERAETMDLMRRHIDTLESMLRDAGYADVAFQFGGGQTQQFAQQDDREGEELPELAPDLSRPTQIPTRPDGATNAVDGQLDIRI